MRWRWPSPPQGAAAPLFQQQLVVQQQLLRGIRPSSAAALNFITNTVVTPLLGSAHTGVTDAHVQRMLPTTTGITWV
jgi:hypothetical protein